MTLRNELTNVSLSKYLYKMSIFIIVTYPINFTTEVDITMSHISVKLLSIVRPALAYPIKITLNSPLQRIKPGE